MALSLLQRALLKSSRYLEEGKFSLLSSHRTCKVSHVVG